MNKWAVFSNQGAEPGPVHIRPDWLPILASAHASPLQLTLTLYYLRHPFPFPPPRPVFGHRDRLYGGRTGDGAPAAAHRRRRTGWRWPGMLGPCALQWSPVTVRPR